MNSISHGPNPLILVVEAGSALLALEFTPDAPAGQLEAGSHPCMGPYTAFHFATYNGTPFFFASYSDTLWFGAIVVQTCAIFFLSLEKNHEAASQP